MNTPLFSIVIPFYNPGNLISNSINSINNLHHNSFEVIFVDDGTTSFKDKTHKFIKEKSNFNFNLIVQNNRGLGEARNTGLKHAKGKWIVFLDCDDSISPQLLDAYEHVIKKSAESEIIFTDFLMVDENTIQLYDAIEINDFNFETFSRKQISKLFLKRKRVLLAPGTAYNADFLRFNNLSFSTIRWSEDQLFIWNCLFKCKSVCHIRASMYNYLGNVSTSIMSATSIDRMIDSYPYFVQIAKTSQFTFTKIFLAQRWLFGTMHTAAVRGDFPGFNKIYKSCNGRKAMNKLILFGDFKIFLLSVINFILGHKVLFRIIRKVEK